MHFILLPLCSVFYAHSNGIYRFYSNKKIPKYFNSDLSIDYGQACEHLKHVLIKVLGWDNLRSFKAKKGVEFLPSTKLEKNRPSKRYIFRACFPTGTSRNWHFSHFFCAIENFSLPSAATPFILCLLFLILSIVYWDTQGTFHWAFFIFGSYFEKF